MYFITASKLHFKIEIGSILGTFFTYYPPLRRVNVVLQPLNFHIGSRSLLSSHG